MLCILDSDRDHDHHDAPLGGTARGLDKAIEKARKAAPSIENLLHVEHLQARDVENLLPLELVELAGRDTHWLAPMKQRGFFARPAVDTWLGYLDLGKDQCERRLLDTKDRETERYRKRALKRIRSNDPTCTGSASTCERIARGESECSSKDSPPPSCIIVHSIGKPLRRIVEALDSEQRNPQMSRSHPSAAAWLAAMLPPDDPAILTPARLAWSWGLCSRPRIRSAP